MSLTWLLCGREPDDPVLDVSVQCGHHHCPVLQVGVEGHDALWGQSLVRCKSSGFFSLKFYKVCPKKIRSFKKYFIQIYTQKYYKWIWIEEHAKNSLYFLSISSLMEKIRVQANNRSKLIHLSACICFLFVRLFVCFVYLGFFDFDFFFCGGRGGGVRAI